jgi:hypothetical protein
VLNASGLRRALDPVANAVPVPEPPFDPDPPIPPLLARMLDRQAAAGLAPPYLPKDEGPTEDDRASNTPGTPTDEGEAE